MASVVVVGGGLAGLVCAWRLARAGHDVEVLECEDEPGGSWRSERRLGFRLDGRPGVALRGDRNLRALLATQGLEPSLAPIPAPALGIVCEDRIVAWDVRSRARLLATAPVGIPAALRCLGVGIEFVRRRQLLDPSRLESAAPLDGPDARTGLRRRVGNDAWDRIVAPALAAAMGAAPDALADAAALSWLRRAVAGLPPMRLEGGASRLLAALASRTSVRTGCDVFRVETETDGARVSYRAAGLEGHVLADAVVVAISGPEVAALCPKLTPGERGFFGALERAPRLSVQLLLDRPPASCPPVVLVPGRAGLGVALLSIEPDAAPPGACLLRVVLDEATGRRLRDAPDADLIAHALHGLARSPLAGPEVAHAIVRRSVRGVPRFAPGSLRRLAAFASRVERSPRLAFACDDLTGTGLEGEVTSGMRAATELARALGAEKGRP